MTRLRYHSALRTHPGLKRAVNEDAALSRDDVRLWVVADGMGGHENGQWASQTLVQQFETLAMPSDPQTRGGAIVAALTAGNRAINDAAQAAGATMGTTAVLLHGEGDDLLVLWVGDSRIYRLRDQALEQLTRDHTLVQDMVDRGLLRADDAEAHPMAHVLSRAVGTEPQLRYDSRVEKVRPGDRYLLCSDGVSKVVADAELAELLGQGGIDGVADRLIERVLAGGAPDNCTLVLLAAEEATALRFATRIMPGAAPA